MSDWSKAEVLKQLRATAQPGKPVRAQVFLNDDIASDDLQAAIKKILTAARKKSKANSPPEIGKIHRMAKSFSVNADPETIAALTDLPAVKSVLPAEIADIYPRPVKAK
jgi:hypothetical protein